MFRKSGPVKPGSGLAAVLHKRDIKFVTASPGRRPLGNGGESKLLIQFQLTVTGTVYSTTHTTLSCTGDRHNMLPPMQVDLLTLKVVSESRVTWATSMPILAFLGLSVLELFPMYTTDRCRRR